MRVGRVLMLLAVGAVVLGGCGSDSDEGAERSRTVPESTDAPETTAAPKPKAPADPGAAEAEIRATFEKYFDSATPEADSLPLAEDIDEILPTLKKAQGVAPGGHRTVAVTSVTFTSDVTADVAFDILYDGNPLLFAFAGGAVSEDGVWKISRKTNCDLTALAGFSCP
ncbi:MAG: hypothetical protein HYU28_08010 [Actinobacteria bacterium]|nr:hypothetical protein [Actinomycetota bacterium]